MLDRVQHLAQALRGSGSGNCPRHVQADTSTNRIFRFRLPDPTEDRDRRHRPVGKVTQAHGGPAGPCTSQASQRGGRRRCGEQRRRRFSWSRPAGRPYRFLLGDRRSAYWSRRCQSLACTYCRRNGGLPHRRLVSPPCLTISRVPTRSPASPLDVAAWPSSCFTSVGPICLFLR
jgi:hypothetical protein